MLFYIKSKLSETSYNDKEFETLCEAQKYLSEQPAPVQRIYSVGYKGPAHFERMLFEGFNRNDLESLLKPLISLDEYVSKDEENIVLAFFVENEPLAVEPLKLFCDQSEGVLETDMSDSDQYENCSIVYVEYKRDVSSVPHILSLIDDVAKVANLKPDDFMVRVSNIDKEYEFSERLLDIYFRKAL